MISLVKVLKGVVHTKMEILSSLSVLFSVDNKRLIMIYDFMP